MIKQHVDYLRYRLLSCQAPRHRISAASAGALSPSWIDKFAQGRIPNPTVRTLEALEAAIDAVSGKRPA